MRHRNRLRERLESDDAVYGARASSCSPVLIEVYGGLGLDFAWVDLEHTGASGLDSVPVERLARAADAADIDLVVRLPSGDPPLIRKVLDAGVRTILIPRVDSPETIRRTVRAATFSYDGGTGEPGVAHARATGWGTDVDLDREDDTVLVGAMIESEAAVEQIDDLLGVPGLGFTYVGPGDLSVSLGHPMMLDHPTVESAIDEAVAACIDAGVPIGTSVTSTKDAEAAREAGYRLIRLGDEVSAVVSAVGDRLDALSGANR